MTHLLRLSRPLTFASALALSTGYCSAAQPPQAWNPILPSGDTTGNTDSQVITGALQQCNGINSVVLETAKFFVKYPGPTPPANCVMWLGFGSNTVADGGTGSITGAQLIPVGPWPPSGDSGPAVLNIIHNRITIHNGQVRGLGTCWGGTGVDAIGIHNAIGTILDDVSTFQGENGVNMLSDNLSGVGDQGYSQINELRFGTDFANCKWGTWVTQLHKGNNSDNRIYMRNYALNGNDASGGYGNLMIQRAAGFLVMGGRNEDTFPPNDTAIFIDSCSSCRVLGTETDQTGGPILTIRDSVHTQIDGIKLARAHWDGSGYDGPYIILDGNNWDTNITNYTADRCVFQVVNYTGGTENTGVYDIYPNQNAVYCNDQTEQALAPFSRNNVSRAWSVLPLNNKTFPGYDIFLAPYFKFALDDTCNPCTIANPTTINGGDFATTLAGTSAHGVFDIVQSPNGGDTITWGSDYIGMPPINLGPNAHTVITWHLAVDGKVHGGTAE